MMKRLILLLMLLIPQIYASSQDTLKVTSEQIRIANLIFAEHQKYSEKIPLLEHQITNLTFINKSWEQTDSIRKLQIQQSSAVIADKTNSIEKLNKSLKRKQKVIIATTSTTIAMLLCLILK